MGAVVVTYRITWSYPKRIAAQFPVLPERGSDESGKSVIILPSQQFANAVLWNLSAAAQHIGEATTCTLIRSTSSSPVWYNSGMSTKTINEVEIWNGIINPDSHDMSAPEANA